MQYANQYSIPRIVIGATQSGSGKTTIVTGLLAALKERGLKVQSFKVGPDYIDPGYHKLASGRTAHNLDTWLTPEQAVPAIFAAACEGADIAVVEGVMGLYDGGRRGVSSTAQVAKLLDAPVLLVIDAKSMGASAAAIAQGFRDYDPEVQLAGVLLNRLGSDTHEAMIREAMKAIDMEVYGALRRNEELKLPERHLGLLPVQENEEQDVVDKIGQAVGSQLDLEALLELAKAAKPLIFQELFLENEQKPTVCRLGVAQDEAFSFYYPTSLNILKHFGAELVLFSPLRDNSLPEVDGLLIGGGFPEMFAAQLSANKSLRQEIREKAAAGMPIYAECGGYMYLMDSLQDFAGEVHAMTGVFSGQAVMTKKLQMVGYVEAVLMGDSLLGSKGTKLHGHEFHFSVEQAAEDGKRPFCFTKLRNNQTYGAGRQCKNALGSYLHLHFAGCPEAAKSFVEKCLAWKLEKERE
ncbi:MAG: cobyrinate a,c-diamide synthase [Selenomonas sp.]|uniref:cobyrinate a,c-diamide synthase n=1 Tax=Selenomonas sp. TaxID=2053611 RepID=UPI0025E716F1|nr:cobyrinate a,c-diamide synthase [Selenomonas sp.]MCR5440460.1 cobyrinate a,c-diamide synthase [Selenomonas sp.]